MIFKHIAEAIKVARADRLFPSVDPRVGLASRLQSIANDIGHEFKPVDDLNDGLALVALESAIQLIGQGETGNNSGPFVQMLVEPAKCPQNWCAGFVGFCYERAAARLAMALPFKRSLGAKKLGANIAAVGRKFMDPREAKPGDVMVFHRGTQGSWMGHIAMVEKVSVGGSIIETIEGNAGPKVMRKAHVARFMDQERFAFFASLRR